MSSITIGVNRASRLVDDARVTKKRIRFETVSQRLENINVDILHRTTSASITKASDLRTDGPIIECFFQHELNEYRKLEKSTKFLRYVDDDTERPR